MTPRIWALTINTGLGAGRVMLVGAGIIHRRADWPLVRWFQCAYIEKLAGRRIALKAEHVSYHIAGPSQNPELHSTTRIA